MDELKLFNGARISIEDGASLGHIEHIAQTEADAVAVCELLTPFNCSHVEFMHDGVASGVYDHVVIVDVPSRTTLENEKVLVQFGRREKTELELRVDTHDEEITELQEVIAEEI